MPREMTVRDEDLAAFSVYARRELALDGHEKLASKYRAPEARASIARLRELNRDQLLRRTRR